jgi:hypothetical protein
MYVADVALGDKSCDVEEAFGGETDRDRDERSRRDNDSRQNRRGSRYDNDRDDYRRPKPPMTIRELVAVLRAPPFCIFAHSYQGRVMEEREVVSVLSHSYDAALHDYGRKDRRESSFKRRSSNDEDNKPDYDELMDTELDNDRFIADVRARMLALSQRDEVIINFGACMAERGLDYEMVFQTILGFNNVSNAEMDRNQFMLCFQLLDFAVEPKQFENFFRSLAQQGDDLVNVADFLKEATKLQHGEQADRNQQKLKKAVERSMRRYQKVHEIQRHIGKVISEERLAGFGSLLKGQDFLDDGMIQRGHFFRTLMSIPALRDHDAGLKEGDVMDLMNELDPDNTQSIELERVKEDLDPWIYDYDYKI